MNQASLCREALKEFPTPELAWFNHSVAGGGTGTESRSLAGSVSKRQMGMRDKPYCFFSAVTLSPDTRSPMGVRIHWYHQLSYFFSPLDDIRLERETGWNHSYTPHGEWSRSSLLFQNVIESLQTKLAWGKTVSTTRKAQVFSKSLVDAMGTEFLLLPLLSTWWLQPLALHGGLWHSRLTHSQTEVPQKRRCVSFLEVPPKGLLYFSDSDWVISSPLNQSLCPESYNDLSSHLCIWHGINSVLNVYELSEEQVSTEVPIKENS